MLEKLHPNIIKVYHFYIKHSSNCPFSTLNTTYYTHMPKYLSSEYDLCSLSGTRVEKYTPSCCNDVIWEFEISFLLFYLK